jgi:excisionase family DNA binding protein
VSISTARARARDRKLISIDDAADVLGLNPRTIRRYIAIGTLPAYRVGGTLVRVDQADVEALVVPIPAAAAAGNE